MINALFFAFFFVLLLAMSLFLSFSWSAPLFFSLHAIGQSILEAATLFLLASWLKKWAPSWLFYLFIGGCFSLLIIHFIDFTMLRLMDDSISYAFRYFFFSGFHHLFVAIQALNLNAKMLALFILAFFIPPVLGIVFYKISEKKMSLNISPWKLALFLLTTAGALYTLDLFARPFLEPMAYMRYQKALPLGTTFLSPLPRRLKLERPIAKNSEHKELLESLKRNSPDLPNIYLFVVETLRKDFVSDDTAPHLSRFAKENISFEESYANASSTHLSWFAIFHAKFPYHWTEMNRFCNRGSSALQMLKKLGYKIRIYSSADLALFGIDSLLLGKNRYLADETQEWSKELFLQPCERDACVFRSFFQDLEKPGTKEGNLFIFFLDSTHSEYSIPKDFPAKFGPITEKIDYLTLTSSSLEKVKNRYKNAIFYVDSLFGIYRQKLQDKGLYENSIIAITGDHGEEFFEEGAIFHGTHLNDYQLSVPLYFRFPEKRKASTKATHLDIFPSILHYLTGIEKFDGLFDGESIFDQNRWPYHLAVLQNGASAPSEFLIQNKEHKLRVKVPSGCSLYSTQYLEVLEQKGDAGSSESLRPILRKD